ncbi:hypothetical protein K457DRAFT_338508 [Linnemannia elongata AG-77]|uniref:Uncharacterized protein n=1 Tax=Linnemannia elongata AG-77 TaxID=1314771 RepID=A0A197K5H4_9FUNG|nr:hypothetical protein K457DRAFT_338508 [Linnemannia elongata AG-77]
MEEMNGDTIVASDDTKHVENESETSYSESNQEVAAAATATEHPAAEPERHVEVEVEAPEFKAPEVVAPEVVAPEVVAPKALEPEAQGILMISLKPGGQDVVPGTQEQQEQPDNQDQSGHHNNHQDGQDGHHDEEGRTQEDQHDSQQDQYDPSAPDIRRQPMDPFLQHNIKVEEEDVYGINSHQAMNRPAHHMNRPVDHFRLYERPSDPFQDMPYGEGQAEGPHPVFQGMYSGGNGEDYDIEANQEQHDKDPFDGIKSGFDLFRGKGVGYQSRGYSGDHSQNRPREINKQDQFKSQEQFKPQDQFKSQDQFKPQEQFKQFNDNKSQGFLSRSSQDGSEIGVPLGKQS